MSVAVYLARFLQDDIDFNATYDVMRMNSRITLVVTFNVQNESNGKRTPFFPFLSVVYVDRETSLHGEEFQKVDLLMEMNIEYMHRIIN